VNYLGSKDERLDRIETAISILMDKVNSLVTGDPATIDALKQQIADETSKAVHVEALLAAEDQKLK
jgi:hypothetical protein